jgi:hypothetical protein
MSLLDFPYFAGLASEADLFTFLRGKMACISLKQSECAVAVFLVSEQGITLTLA